MAKAESMEPDLSTPTIQDDLHGFVEAGVLPRERSDYCAQVIFSYKVATSLTKAYQPK